MFNFIRMTFLMVLLVGIFPLWSQDGERTAELERELDRLQRKIQEARQLTQLVRDPELHQFVLQAENQYQLAQQAFQARDYLRSASYIKLAYFHLSQFYQRIKKNDYIRRKFLETLDTRIQEAEQAVQESSNTEAEKLLNRARYFRQRAIQNAETDRPEAAIRSYAVAIYFAENAIRVATRQDLPEGRDFARYLDDSRTLLNQVEEMAGVNPEEVVSRIISQSRQQLEEVQRLYDQKLFRPAVQELLIVNRYLYRALDLLETKPGLVAERVEADLQILEQQLAVRRQEVDADGREETRRLYERAVFTATTARQNYDQKEYLTARNRLSIASRLLFQLSRYLNQRPAVDDRQMENQIQTAGIMLQSLSENRVADDVYAGLWQLLDRNYRQARRQFELGNREAALQYLKFFNGLALKMGQMKNSEKRSEVQDQQMSENLQRLNAMLDHPPAEIESDMILESRYENARQLYRLAVEACQAGQKQVCDQITRMATHLITQ